MPERGYQRPQRLGRGTGRGWGAALGVAVRGGLRLLGAQTWPRYGERRHYPGAGAPSPSRLGALWPRLTGRGRGENRDAPLSTPLL